MITESSCATPRTEQADVKEKHKEDKCLLHNKNKLFLMSFKYPTEFCPYSSLVFYITDYFIRFHNLPVI